LAAQAESGSASNLVFGIATMIPRLWMSLVANCWRSCSKDLFARCVSGSVNAGNRIEDRAASVKSRSGTLLAMTVPDGRRRIACMVGESATPPVGAGGWWMTVIQGPIGAMAASRHSPAVIHDPLVL